MIRKLSCHCGAVKLEVNAELTAVTTCNCSTCARWGMLYWKVPSQAVRLATPSIGMGTYYWRFANEGFHWCSTCGTPMYRTWPADMIYLNARCIEGVDIFTLEVIQIDGKAQMQGGPVPPLADTYASQEPE